MLRPSVRGFARAALALALTASVAAPNVAWAAQPSPKEQAEAKYKEGSAKYSAADYQGAIAAFTEALEIVTGNLEDPMVRGALLLNLAKAHAHAYDVDADIGHLRQARSIYTRFVSEADNAGYAAEDVTTSEAAIAELEARIEAYEEEHRPASGTPVGPTAPSAGADPNVADAGQIRRTRNTGIGLTAAGAVAIAGGVGLLVYGSTFRSAAIASVEAKGQDPADETTFIDQEAQKGNIVMAVGGVVGALGLAGIIIGPIMLAKSKRLSRESEARFVPLYNGRFAGLAVAGRF